MTYSLSKSEWKYRGQTLTVTLIFPCQKVHKAVQRSEVKQKSYRLVFTGDRVGIGVVSAPDLVKIENRSRKQSQNGSIFFRFLL